MALNLGRSFGHPLYVFLQIVYAVSLFFTVLGGFRVLFAVGEVISLQDTRASSTDAPTKSKATDAPTLDGLFSRCFYISMDSLFRIADTTTTTGRSFTTSGSPGEAEKPSTTTAPLAASTDGLSTAQFALLHLFTAASISYPLSTLLQRRKFVVDFTATIYIVYLILTDLVLGRVLGGGGVEWWLCVLCCGAGCTGCTTWFLCKRRELQVISFGGGTGSGTTTLNVAAEEDNGTSSNNNVNDGGDARNNKEKGDHYRVEGTKVDSCTKQVYMGGGVARKSVE